MTPFDVLARRTSLTLEDRQRGLGVLDEVAALMAKEHNWTPEQERAMIDDFRDSTQRQMASEALDVTFKILSQKKTGIDNSP